ncbi:MAG: hypothetical protein KQ78_01452 [Candidatus Izimaplasma bacterium HR2]|nr:MAG: hypothetical protein KQ78_01452 [Candidatus Izimaplasma bacterium HR2]
MDESLKKISKYFIITLISIMIIGVIAEILLFQYSNTIAGYENTFAYAIINYKVTKILELFNYLHVFSAVLIIYVFQYSKYKNSKINILPLLISLGISLAIQIFHIIYFAFLLDNPLNVNLLNIAFFITHLKGLLIFVSLLYIWIQIYLLENKKFNSYLLMGLSCLLLPTLLGGIYGLIYLSDETISIFSVFGLGVDDGSNQILKYVEATVSTISYTAALIFFIFLREKNISSVVNH